MASLSLTPDRATEAPTETRHEAARVGRPRDPRADHAILQAVLDLAAAEGLAAITVDAVAQRAGCGKATIYRRWTSKEAMLLDAWRGLAAPIELPDTGSLRGDLTAMLGKYTTAETDSVVGRTLPQLIAAARVNPDLEVALNEFIAERRKPVRVVFDRAAARGEIRPGLDFELVHDLVTGPAISRLVVRGLRLSARDVEQLVDLILAAVAPR